MILYRAPGLHIRLMGHLEKCKIKNRFDQRVVILINLILESLVNDRPVVFAAEGFPERKLVPLVQYMEEHLVLDAYGDRGSVHHSQE